MTPTTPRSFREAASPSPPNGCSFSLLHDKPLSGEVSLGCWSPTMDLLALIMEDGQLCVHRLDWSKLWLAVPGIPVTAMCWRPDGKLLAVGHEDGSHSLYDIERACLSHHSLCLHAGQVTGLSWVESNPGPMGSDATRALHYRHTRFFAVPPFTHPAPGMPSSAAAAASGPTGPTTETAAAQAWVGGEGSGTIGGGGGSSSSGSSSSSESLDILVSTSSSGSIALCAFGSVLVATMQITTTTTTTALAASNTHSTTSSQAAGKLMQPAVSSPLNQSVQMHKGPPAQCQSFLARDLSMLFGVGVATMDKGEGAGEALGGSGGSILEGGPSWRQTAVLRVWDTCVLQLEQKGVTMMSLLTSELLKMLTVCSAALSSAHKEWSAAQAEVTQRLSQLEEVLRDHGSQISGVGGGQSAMMMAEGMDPDQEDDSMVVVDELVGVLATGHVSPGLQAFLVGNLKEAGLRKMAKALDNAVQSVHTLLLDHVAPAAEVATFILGEMKGMAAAAHMNELLGVSEAACTRAEMCGAKVLLQCEALRVTVTRVGVQYRALSIWLLQILQRMEVESGNSREGEGPAAAGLSAGAQVDVMAVLDCLEGQLQEDQVGQDLQECPYRPYNEVGSLCHSPALLPTLKSLMEVMYTSTPVQLGPEVPAPTPKTAEDETWLTRPLRAQLLALQKMCTETLRQVPLHLSPRFVLLMEVPLYPLPHPLRSTIASPSPLLQLRCSMTLPQLKTEPSSGPVQLCCWVPDCTAGSAATSRGGGDRGSAVAESLLLLQLSRGSQGQVEQQVKIHATIQQLPVGVNISDLAFYKATQVLLLLHSSNPASPSPKTPLLSLPPFPLQLPPLPHQQQQLPSLPQQQQLPPLCPSPSDPHAPRRASFSNQSPMAAYSSNPSTPNMNVGVGRLLRRRSGSVAMVSMRVEVGGGNGGGEGTPLGGETPRGGADGGTPARTPGGGWGGSGEEVAGYSLIALLPALAPLSGGTCGGGGSMVLISPANAESVLQRCLSAKARGGVQQVALSELRSRRCPMGGYTALLSGAARGTAAVFSSMSRVQVLDVEEDEEQEEEVEEEGGDLEDAMQEGPDA